MATEAFRSEGQLAAVAREIQIRFGNLTILDPHSEAKLFYQSVRVIEGFNQFTAADVGGGSVQVVWGIEPESHLSIPVGTYRLEKEYQEVAGVSIDASGTVATKMRQRVLNELGDLKIRVPRQCREPLVFGSNVMRDFFESALNRAGLEPPVGVVQRADLDTLFCRWAGHQYTELAEYFPSNPGFMFGADKLLIVVAAIMDAMNVKTAYATNASIAKGLALAAQD